MTVSTLRPDATVGNDGALTGAATLHGAWSDDSDSSYVTLDHNEDAGITLSDFTLPAGAVVKSVALRARCARGSGITSGLLGWSVAGLASPGFGTVNVNWSTPATVTATTQLVSLDEADVDAFVVGFDSSTAGFSPRVHEVYVDVTYVAIPVVAIDAVTDPTTDTNQPTFTWVVTLDSDGGVQTRYEVKVFTDAEYGAGGFDPDTSTPTATSGITSSASTSWQVDENLADDTYRVYVRVAQTVNGVLHWSDWDFDEFAVSVELPTAPDVTVAADDADGRISVAIDPLGVPTSYDSFTRTVAASDTWGTAELSPGDDDWEVSFGNAGLNYASVAGGVALYQSNTSATGGNRLHPALSDFTATAKFRLQALPSGGSVYYGLFGRYRQFGADPDHVRARVRFNGSARVTLMVTRDVGGVATNSTEDDLYDADTGWWWHKFQAIGDTIRAKVWPDGDAEPDWQLEMTHADIAAMTETDVGVRFPTASGSSLPLIEVDDFRVVDSGGTATTDYVEAQRLIGRINQVLDPSFEHADLATYWAAYQNGGTGTIERSSQFSRSGDYCAKLTATSAISDLGAVSAASPAAWVKIRPGQTLRAAGYSRASTTTRQFHMLVAWYDSSGVFVSSDLGAFATNSASDWTRSADLEVEAVEEAAYAAVYISHTGGLANGEVHFVDDIMATVDEPLLDSYFDGDSAGAGWEGNEHASRSFTGDGWETVRQLEAGEIANDDGVITLYDYEAPNGEIVYYRARALHDYSGVLAASAWTETVGSWTSTDWWVKHPHRPDLNVALHVRSYKAKQRAGRVGVFQALGASYPVVVQDTRETARGEIVLRLDSEAEQDALDALLDTYATLLIQGPSGSDEPGYVRVLDHARERVFDRNPGIPSFDTLTIVAVASPSGDVVAWP
jgi:hypothetical protein